MGVKIIAGLLTDVVQRTLPRPAFSVGTVRDQCVVNVCHGEDAGGQGNFLPLQAAGIARAVPFLVMTVGNIQGIPQVVDIRIW
jgi:hypothetical protein